MNPSLTIDFGWGFLTATAIWIILWVLIIKATNKSKKSTTTEEEDRKDPANWWKYGGDPYGDSVYDKEK